MVFFDVAILRKALVRQQNFWMCFWPGLLSLWQKGDRLGLLGAVAFSILLNLALLSTMVWPQLLGSKFPQGLWIVVAAIWIGSTWYQVRRVRLSETTSRETADNDDALFIQAQTEYLKGNWEEAEWLLRQRLATSHRDIEARLMLATLYRHQGHRQLAQEQLQILNRFDQATDWIAEIDCEAAWLESESVSDDRPAEASEFANTNEDSTAEIELRKMNIPSVRRAA